MTKQHETHYVAIVTSREADAAFRFHEKIAAIPDSHLWARPESEIKHLIRDRSLFGVWQGDDRRLVALCYVLLDEKEQTWEIGGLAVDEAVKKRGIGTVLVRFTLAYTVIYQEPWKYKQTVIAHVHESNNDPRGILEKLGFEFSKKVEVPESANPPDWMKRNAEGKIFGDEFNFPPGSLKNLSTWFDRDLDNLINEMGIEFGFGPHFSLDDFKGELRDISEEM